jgi:hypothetical protein
MLQTKRALVMTILIAVIAGTAGIAASTMVAKPVYAECTPQLQQQGRCFPPGSPESLQPVPGCFPPGSGVPTSDTKLTLEAVQSAAVKGKLVCEKGVRYDNNPGIAGATITFTGSMPHSLTAETDSNGDYLAGLGTPEKPGTYNVQAHFSGATLRGSPGRVSFTGSDSDIVTIHVRSVNSTQSR